MSENINIPSFLFYGDHYDEQCSLRVVVFLEKYLFSDYSTVPNTLTLTHRYLEVFHDRYSKSVQAI